MNTKLIILCAIILTTTYCVLAEPVNAKGKKQKCIEGGEWCDASFASTPCCGEYCAYDDREFGFRCPKDTAANPFTSTAPMIEGKP